MHKTIKICCLYKPSKYQIFTEKSTINKLMAWLFIAYIGKDFSTLLFYLAKIFSTRNILRKVYVAQEKKVSGQFIRRHRYRCIDFCFCYRWQEPMWWTPMHCPGYYQKQEVDQPLHELHSFLKVIKLPNIDGGFIIISFYKSSIAWVRNMKFKKSIVEVE